MQMLLKHLTSNLYRRPPHTRIDKKAEETNLYVYRSDEVDALHKVNPLLSWATSPNLLALRSPPCGVWAEEHDGDGSNVTKEDALAMCCRCLGLAGVEEMELDQPLNKTKTSRGRSEMRRRARAEKRVERRSYNAPPAAPLPRARTMLRQWRYFHGGART
jgi:hypothetical protein